VSTTAALHVHFVLLDAARAIQAIGGAPSRAVIDPIAARQHATPQQIALAWQLHRTSCALSISPAPPASGTWQRTPRPPASR